MMIYISLFRNHLRNDAHPYSHGRGPVLRAFLDKVLPPPGGVFARRRRKIEAKIIWTIGMCYGSRGFLLTMSGGRRWHDRIIAITIVVTLSLRRLRQIKGGH